MTDTTPPGLESVLDGYERRPWQTVDEGTVRFALIGLGWWTVDQVLPALSETAHAEASVLVSSSTEKATDLAAEWESVERGITYDEFHAGEAEAQYDAVYVCTPNAYHRDFVETAADLGKAVLCEKPMEASVDRARDIVDACEEADVPLMIGYRMQTDPTVRHARELIRRGVIGRPVHVLGTNAQRLLELIPNPDQWRLDPDVTGYGTSVMDLGVYPLNTTRFLLEADPVRAQAMADSHGEAFADVPDERSAFTVEFDDGTYLVATATQNAHGSTSLRVVGTTGQLVFEPAFHMETELRIERGDDVVAVSPDQVDQMAELFAFFADRVLGDAPIEADGRHGLVDMETMRAIYESSETGQTVDVEVEK